MLQALRIPVFPRRPIVLALTVALVACAGATESDVRMPSPSVRASPTTTVTPSPAETRIPGAPVQVAVNDGTFVAAGHGMAASGEGPTIVTLAFPFAVDRASVEQWIPDTATRRWTDDRTLRLTFLESDEHISFKVAETRAANGGVLIGPFTVDVRFPEARVVRIYTIADLSGGVRVPTPSTSTRVRRGDGLTLSPDGKTAIVFDGFGPEAGPAPTLFDMRTKALTTLSQPPASDGWFSFADWLPDGRLVMVAKGVWVGDGRGASMRRVADAQAAVGGYPWLAVPDPSGRRLALWGYNADGHVAIVDLSDGSVRRITGPFRRSGADAAVRLAWSEDGSLIAGTDSDDEAGPAKARVRVVDVANDRTVRTLEGNVYAVSGLANGELIITRDSGERGAGGRLLGLRTGFDLIERARYLGCGWATSLDRRYLLQTECGGAGYQGYTLFDLGTGASHSFGLPAGVPRWLADGRVAYY